ncbi:hypothetical protein [Streptomyces sp. CB03238]|uniref:hypothetical protein n=1 Tax=Streptomyces sp. CB03238 TaxID=1907777 RepID=UPI000A256049|nr:hypothetical protein [Streptomyces sp. CB03238]ORT54641.1 hypothetical protein BKD26_34685 [Streptomyces sp. CB03238]
MSEQSREGSNDAADLGAGELARMRGCLLGEKRRVRQARVFIVINVALAVLCGLAVALSAQPLAVRGMLTASIMLLGVSIVVSARRYRSARACRTSYQWHVNYLESHAKRVP